MRIPIGPPHGTETTACPVTILRDTIDKEVIALEVAVEVEVKEVALDFKTCRNSSAFVFLSSTWRPDIPGQVMLNERRL